MRPVDIEGLLERLEIRFERRGRFLYAKCPSPDHDDRNPSWSIRDEPDNEEKHGRHKCWSCEFGGYPIHLVEAVLGVDRDDAREWLRGAGRAPSLMASRVQVVERRRQVGLRRGGFQMPPGVLFDPLGDWATPARRFAEGRGLTADQVARWGIGYAVDGWLGGRIVFIARDPRGAPTNYSARSYVGHERKYKMPKVDHNPDPAAIFGEEHWPPQGSRTGTVVVVEGALDGLAVERATGMAFAALHGSELHPGQAARLGTWRRVLVATDPDKAGEKIARQLHAALARWVALERWTPMAGHDCNSMPPDELRRALRSRLGELPSHGDRSSLRARPTRGAG